MDNHDRGVRTGQYTGANEWDFRVVDVQEQATAVVAGRVPVSDLRDFFDQAFQDLGSSMAQSGFEPIGPALCLYQGVPVEMVELEVGFPVSVPVLPSGSVVSGRMGLPRVHLTPDL
jgi:hypothetical protein